MKLNMYSLIIWILFYLCKSAPPLGFLPNIIILYADDLGYGDLEGYGNPVSITPNLDKLIRQGTKLTAFYSASPVCSPSRAALLTGRFQTRSGVWGPKGSPLVFYQASIGGLPFDEITIPEFLKMNGLNYSSAIVGKWHLGISENYKYLPLNHGFDFFTGLPTVSDDPNPPYCFPDKRGCWPATPIDPWNNTCPDSNLDSNFDSFMNTDNKFDDNIEGTFKGTGGVPPNPLFLNNEIIQQPVNITMTPSYYTDACLNHISSAMNRSQPFFLYMAFHQTHHPQFASSMFFNKTQRGMFGDALSEMDYQVGRIIDYLIEKEIDDKTFVFFSSDNGPSFMRETRGGNAGPLKCGKGTTYEGGVRVPGIAWMPNYIQSGRTTRGIGSTLDLLPTIADLVDQTLPNDRYYDGISMYEWLFKQDGKSKREINYYWPEDPNPNLGWQQSLHSIRINEWKLHWITAGSHCNNDYADTDCRNNATEKILTQPILFNLYHDVGEKYPVDITQTYYQNIVNKINESWSNILSTDGIFGTSQITMGSNNSYAPCCNKDINNCYPSPNSSWPSCCTCDKMNETFPHFVY